MGPCGWVCQPDSSGAVAHALCSWVTIYQKRFEEELHESVTQPAAPELNWLPGPAVRGGPWVVRGDLERRLRRALGDGASGRGEQGAITAGGLISYHQRNQHFTSVCAVRLPREVVESPSLEIFKTRLDKILCSLL